MKEINSFLETLMRDDLKVIIFSSSINFKEMASYFACKIKMLVVVELFS